MTDTGTHKPLPKRRIHLVMLVLLTLAMLLPGLASVPVIDRDEARYAQASVQMAESGDWLNIRFQDEARNKKPAGVYWAQAAMIKVFAPDGERKIWAQRLPSVLGGMIAVLMTYLAGLRLIGRQGALLAAGTLTLSLIFVFEAHIAKTDALLCAATTAVLAAFAHLRNPARKGDTAPSKYKNLWVWVFWIAAGLGIMIKGPIILALAVMTLTMLGVWERSLAWAKPLLSWPAIVVFILIWLPWAVAIYAATDGAFFVESLGNDLGGKLVSAQEKHPGPPGYHAALIWLTFWPGCLFLLPGIAYGLKAVRGRHKDTSPLPRAMRLCLAWIVPFWILIEVMPTKLPHYSLPLFSALAIMIGAAMLTLTQISAFPKSRFFGGLMFIISSAVVIAVLLYARISYGPTDGIMAVYIVATIAGLVCLIAAVSLWAGKSRVAMIAGGLAAVGLSGAAYGYILPGLSDFQTSEKVAARIGTGNYDKTMSVTYSEPSLVYYSDKSIRLAGQGDPIKWIAPDHQWLVDLAHETTPEFLQNLQENLEPQGLCQTQSDPIEGFNYSKGDPVSIVIVTAEPCPAVSGRE